MDSGRGKGGEGVGGARGARREILAFAEVGAFRERPEGAGIGAECERGKETKLIEDKCTEEHSGPSMDHSASLQSLDGAILGKIWPAQFVLMGILVCKWVRAELLLHAPLVELSPPAMKSQRDGREAVKSNDQSFVDFYGKEEITVSTFEEESAAREENHGAEMKQDQDDSSQELVRNIEQCVGTTLLSFQYDAFRFQLNLPSDEQTADAILAGVQRAGMCARMEQLVISKTRTSQGSKFLSRILQLLVDCSALKVLTLAELVDGPIRLSDDEPSDNLDLDLDIHCPSLSQLHLGSGWNELLTQDILLFSILPSLPTLPITDLNLGSSNLFCCPDSCPVLERVLPKCTALRNLHLGVNNSRPFIERRMNSRRICGMLEQCASLRYLDLGENELHTVDFNAAMPTVRELRLGTNRITPSGIRPLARCIGTWSELRVLHLGHNQLGDAGIATLWAAIRGTQLPSLRVLKLGTNSIGCLGAVHLANLLRTTKTIEELHLGRNRIGDDGFFALFTSFREVGQTPESMLSLKTLHLGRNIISSNAFWRVREATAYAPCFRWGQNLTSLDLGRNKIDDQALVCLAADLQHRSHANPLRLKLGSNQVGDRGLKSIVDAVLEHQPRTVLDFGTNFFSPFAFARAEAALRYAGEDSGQRLTEGKEEREESKGGGDGERGKVEDGDSEGGERGKKEAVAGKEVEPA